MQVVTPEEMEAWRMKRAHTYTRARTHLSTHTHAGRHPEEMEVWRMKRAHTHAHTYTRACVKI